MSNEYFRAKNSQLPEVKEHTWDHINNEFASTAAQRIYKVGHYFQFRICKSSVKEATIGSFFWGCMYLSKMLQHSWVWTQNWWDLKPDWHLLVPQVFSCGAGHGQGGAGCAGAGAAARTGHSPTVLASSRRGQRGHGDTGTRVRPQLYWQSIFNFPKPEEEAPPGDSTQSPAALSCTQPAPQARSPLPLSQAMGSNQQPTAQTAPPEENTLWKRAETSAWKSCNRVFSSSLVKKVALGQPK